MDPVFNDAAPYFVKCGYKKFEGCFGKNLMFLLLKLLFLEGKLQLEYRPNLKEKEASLAHLVARPEKTDSERNAFAMALGISTAPGSEALLKLDLNATRSLIGGWTETSSRRKHQLLGALDKVMANGLVRITYNNKYIYLSFPTPEGHLPPVAG